MRKSKNRYFYHIFVSPGDAPGGKRTRCLQIVSLHVPIYLLPFLRYSDIFVKKSSFYHTPLHSTPPLGGFPSEYRHPLWDGKTRMMSLSDGEKISKISFFNLSHHIRVVENFGPDLLLLFKVHKIWSVILRKIIKIAVTSYQIFMLKYTKCDFGWGSAPDPAGGAYSAPQTP